MKSVELVAATIRHEVAGEPDLMERIRKAMKAAKSHWMVTDEDDQLKGAIVAAILESSEDEQERIKDNWNVVLSFNALVSGVAVDTAASLGKVGEDRAIPLLAMWREA